MLFIILYILLARLKYKLAVQQKCVEKDRKSKLGEEKRKFGEEIWGRDTLSLFWNLLSIKKILWVKRGTEYHVPLLSISAA